MSKSWRSCKDWIDYGLPFTTTSDDACRLYHAVLSQIVGLHDDPTVGGFAESTKRLVDDHPNFVMGKVLVHGFSWVSGAANVKANSDYSSILESMVNLSRTTEGLTDREKKHVTAVKLWTEGKKDEAQLTWEDILTDFPTDMLANRMTVFSYLETGRPKQLRDSVARVIPYFKPNDDNYGYIHGCYCFGLEESENYDLAEKMGIKIDSTSDNLIFGDVDKSFDHNTLQDDAMFVKAPRFRSTRQQRPAFVKEVDRPLQEKALEVHPSDAFANHALAHVHEMTGRFNEGIKRLESNTQDWAQSFLSCHTFWHLALYYIEKGDFEAALNLYDTEVLPRFKQNTEPIDISDAVSALYRLEFEGIDVGDRWQEVFEYCKPRMYNMSNVFYDAHTFGSCVGAKKDEAQDMLKAIKDFMQNGDGYFRDVMEKMGLNMFEALQAYGSENYEKAVELLYPIRYDIFKTGGSNAQRDVFNLLLINCAIKSPLKKHKRLAGQLLIERKALKENSPLTDRLFDKLKTYN